MAGSPIVITFYDESNEKVKEFTRSIIPWGILKQAIKLSQSIDEKNPTEEDIDKLAALVVSVFGDQFTVEDLDKYVDAGEMMAILGAVMTRANSGFSYQQTNPTMQA